MPSYVKDPQFLVAVSHFTKWPSIGFWTDAEKKNCDKMSRKPLYAYGVSKNNPNEHILQFGNQGYERFFSKIWYKNQFGIILNAYCNQKGRGINLNASMITTG